MTRLRFRIETPKMKSPRVVVLRMREENHRIIHKTLGSFSARRSYDPIVKQLTPEEHYEFENFVKVLDFSNRHFGCEADALDRFIIKVAPAFKQVLFKLWEKAKTYDIEFIPEYEMLLAILNKAKALEQQLALFDEGEFKGLALQGIDITDFHPPKRDLKADQKLFQALVEHTPSLEKLADLSNTLAVHKYQKSPKFKPHHFDYLKNQAEPKGSQPFPKWYYTVALDILEQLAIDPVVSLPRLTTHWLRLNQKETLALTIQAFNQQFAKLKDNPICIQRIKAAFMLDELAKIHPLGQKKLSTLPSAVIEPWIKSQQKKQPHTTVETLMTKFNQSFPNLANHPFLMQLIKQSGQVNDAGS